MSLANVDLPLGLDGTFEHSERRPRLRRVPERGAAFLTPSLRSESCRALADAGYLVARVVPVVGEAERQNGTGLSVPGSLPEALAAAVEISLALRGALPPAVEIDAGIEATARDQLFRIRVLEAAGLCIVLPPLAPIAPAGILHPEDGAVLTHYHALCREEPIVLLFDASDRELSILAPQPLTAIFTPAAVAHPLSSQASRRAVTLVPPAEDAPTRPWGARIASHDDDPLELDADLASDLDDDLSAEEALASEPGLAIDPLVDDEEEEDEEDAEDAEDAGALDADLDEASEPGESRELDIDRAFDDEDDALDDDTLYAELAKVHAISEVASVAGSAERGRLIKRDPLDGIEVDDLEIDEGEDEEAPLPCLATCEAHCRALEQARGPKPVRVIEELFTRRYVPLREALSRGLDDLGIEEVVNEWAESFEKSYTEGFKTMRLTGKRPSMVLDAPEVATRMGRAHGARAVQLVLVDAMRFDLGQRVKHALGEHLEGRARCVEEAVLWSALPAVTPTQMRLLAQGARGLGETSPASEADPTIHRDGSLATLRRVRIGQRDLVKLDLVEARLRDAGPGFDARLDAIAAEVAGVVGAFAASLPPRTLVFVFGDHGFELPVLSPRSTGPATQGGVSPDEVLVGAQGWLVG